MRIGVLRGHEESFPEAFIAKVNSMGRGVGADYVHLGGTRADETVPYRVIVDRMSMKVPYYATYLRMAALQGTYCINDVFLGGDDEFCGCVTAERLGIRFPRTVALPNREYGDDVGGDGLRNLWPTDFGMYLEYVGVPCLLRPAGRASAGHARIIGSLDDLIFHYNASGRQTMLLQEQVPSEMMIRVLTIGRRWARAIRFAPDGGSSGTFVQEADAVSAPIRERAEEIALTVSRALGYDLNTPELAVHDGELVAVDIANGAPDLDYRLLGDAHFPWVVDRMAELAVDKFFSDVTSPRTANFDALLSGD